jgi:hypothetical protein
MRALAASLLVLAAGCGANDPCAGKSGLCVIIEVRGPDEIGTFDHLQISATPKGQLPLVGFSDDPGPISLPVQLAALFPDQFSGDIDIYVSVSRNDLSVGGGGNTVHVPPSGQRVIVDLTPIPIDGGTPDQSLPDLAKLVSDGAMVPDAISDASAMHDQFASIDAPPPMIDLSSPFDLASTTPVLDHVFPVEEITNTLTWMHTVGNGPNAVLIVAVANNGQQNITSVTVDNAKMTQVDSKLISNLQTAVYFLKAPPPGPRQISVSAINVESFAAVSVSAFNVSQAVPLFADASGVGMSGIVTVNSDFGHLVLDAMGAYGNSGQLGPNGVQTIQGLQSTGPGAGDAEIGVSTRSGLMGPTAMSWTSQGQDPWALIAIDLVPM